MRASRWGFGLTAVGLVACFAAPQSARAVPCGQDDRLGVVDVLAPPQLAFGRQAEVVLAGSGTDGRMENMRLEFQSGQGEVLFSRLLTTPETTRLARKGPEIHFPIRVEDGAGRVLVRLSYTKRTRSEVESGDPGCEIQRQGIVRTFAGVRPQAIYLSGLSLRLPSCERLMPGNLRVVVSHHRWRRVWRTQSRPCISDDYPWKSRGSGLPGLRYEQDFNSEPNRLNFEPVGLRRRWTRHYRFDVVWNGRRVSRRWLRLVVTPARRIYETDTDEYVEICLVEGSKIVSPTIYTDVRGRKYCRVGSARQGFALKNRPKGASP